MFGMPPNRKIEFAVDLIHGTTPISKRPYHISTGELKEPIKKLNEMEKRFNSTKCVPLAGPPSLIHRGKEKRK
jgi:hypothetical protein